MRIVFDQGTPAPLRQFLRQHIVSTAYELGWSSLVLPFASCPRLKAHVQEIELATNALKPGDYVVLRLS